MRLWIAPGALLLALTACGGGGTSVPPHEVGPTPGTAPTPTATPTNAAPQYQTQIVWTGLLHPTSNTQSRHRLDAGTGTPSPILVSVPAQLISGQTSSAFSNGVAYAVASVMISPQPSAVPIVAWSDTSPDVSLATPMPQPTGQPTSAPGSIVVNASQVGSSTLTATVTSPIASTETIAVNTYQGFQIQCQAFSSSQSGTQPFGITFNADGSYSFATSPTGADLYVTGPPPNSQTVGECDGAFQTPAGSNYEFVAPGGIVDLGNSDPYLPDITTAQFTGSAPQIQIPTDGPGNALFQNSVYLMQTHLGTFVKFRLEATQISAYGLLSGQYEETSMGGAFPF